MGVNFIYKSIDFASVLPLWKTQLWPLRTDPILPVSAIKLGGGIEPSLLEKQVHFLGAYDGDELVGAVSGFETGDGTFRLRGLIVLPGRRGKGLGRALLQNLMALHPAVKLFWTAPRQDNLDFYQRVGFLKVGEWTFEHFVPGPNCYAIFQPPPQNVFDPDAFSSGQIVSKLWLCQELERVVGERSLPHQVVWHLCGWNGLLPFLLFARERLNIAKIRSFDIDSRAVATADQFLNTWEWQDWKFKALCHDIHSLNYSEPEKYHSPPAQIVINCALEHLAETTWWERVPEGITVVLQGTDMANHDHVVQLTSPDDLLGRYPCREIYFSGSKKFAYASGFKFSRFMVIARK